MKERVEIMQTTRTIYVADDGMEFNSKTQCAEHENALKQYAAEKKIRELPCFELYPPGAGGHEDDDTYAWYRVSSEEELENLKTALYCDDCSANEFELFAYPAWVLAVTDGEGYGWMQTYDDYIEEMRRHLAELDNAIKGATPSCLLGATNRMTAPTACTPENTISTTASA